MKILRYLSAVSLGVVAALIFQINHPSAALAVTQADFSSVYESSTGCNGDLAVNTQKTTGLYATYDCVHLIDNVKGSYVTKPAPSGATPCPDATVDKFGPQAGLGLTLSGKLVCVYFPDVNTSFSNPNLGKPQLSAASGVVPSAGCSDGSATCASTLNGKATKTNCPSGSGNNKIFIATPGLNLDCTGGKNPIYALLQFVINWAIRLLGVLAVIAIVISGIQYIVSQGSPDGIKAAKSRLTHAVVGLILLSLMFVILRLLGVG